MRRFTKSLFGVMALAGAPAACAEVPATAAGEGAVALGLDAEGRFTVPVLVNGEGPYDFVIDTAAQTTAVSEALVAAAGLQPDPVRKAQVHGASGVATLDLYPIARLEFAGVIRENVLAPALGAGGGHGDEDSGHAGALGANLFANARIAFDVEHLQFSVEEGAPAAPPAGFDRLPFEKPYGVFIKIAATIDGVPMTAIVDSGARGTAANRAAMRALGIPEDGLQPFTRPTGVSGHEATFFRGFSGDLKIGARTIGDLPIAFSDLSVFGALGLGDGPAILIGVDALKRLGAVAIDYRTSELQIARE